MPDAGSSGLSQMLFESYLSQQRPDSSVQNIMFSGGYFPPHLEAPSSPSSLTDSSSPGSLTDSTSSGSEQSSSSSAAATELSRPQRTKRKRVLSQSRQAEQQVSAAEDKKARRRKQNRIAAHISREKKKHYVSDLEARAQFLEEQNAQLQARLLELERENLLLRGARAPQQQPALSPTSNPSPPSAKNSVIPPSTVIAQPLSTRTPLSPLTLSSLAPANRVKVESKVAQSTAPPSTAPSQSSHRPSQQSPACAPISSTANLNKTIEEQCVTSESAELAFSQQSKVTTAWNLFPENIFLMMMVFWTGVWHLSLSPRSSQKAVSQSPFHSHPASSPSRSSTKSQSLPRNPNISSTLSQHSILAGRQPEILGGQPDPVPGLLSGTRLRSTPGAA